MPTPLSGIVPAEPREELMNRVRTARRLPTEGPSAGRIAGSRRQFGVCLLGAMAWLAGGLPASGAEPAGRPISVPESISYFLLNCIYYGTWPEPVSPTAQKRIRLGILGRDTLGRSLRKAADEARDTWFKGGAVDILNADKPSALVDCHAVFVSSLPAGGMAALRTEFAGKPLLLVGDQPNFAREGGTVGLRIEEERLIWEINLDQLSGTGVELSSKLRQRASALIRDGRHEPNRR